MSLNSHLLFSDVQIGLYNVASQSQTPVAFMSTAALSDNYQATALTHRHILHMTFFIEMITGIGNKTGGNRI